MCGITGWVDWERRPADEPGVLEAMTDTLACRGPDGRGTWLDGHAAIGHRRLAVIDPKGGAQPMLAHARPGSKPVVLTFSGEVYNFAELRTELRARGHRFTTRSDTEVVLRAYLEWGAECVRRLEGMFAFAVFDAERERLLLARDRLGIKPLYYHHYAEGIVFGSEPKALLASPVFDAALDDEGVLELFAMFGTRTPGNAVLRDLHELRPGSLLEFDRRGARTRTYWRLRSAPHTDDLDTTVRTVRGLLDDSVNQQLVSDVPLCALVSGGLDSSLIGVLASGAVGAGALSTFAVDFAGSAADFRADANRPTLDAPYVRTLVEHIESRHTDVVLDVPDLLSTFERATRARDLPCLGDLDGSLYLLFEAIAGRSTVALSGESADEVFGGYAWFHDRRAIARDGFPWNLDDTGFANVLTPALKQRLQPQRYAADRYADALAEVPRLAGEDGVDRRMREVSYLALTRFLPVLLDRKDRMSMAVGLEVRVPFCDTRLVEYVWNVPWAMKAIDGTPKGLLRRVAADLLPRELVDRPKTMYPTAPDPRYDAAVRAAARSLLAGDSAIRPLLDVERVTALVDGDSRRPAWMQRMALAYLTQIELWLRRYEVKLTVSV
ncbi:asparagine synthase (glutamine-hydrolyzing) [Kribbella sp. NPDC050124]|uniref:asparagine synthase (glutamine-hydrolyzing) n=1 Tax=Kribbella sp. NPDC050124 TaxID=3364114 RepID=UPI0037BCFEB2